MTEEAPLRRTTSLVRTASSLIKDSRANGNFPADRAVDKAFAKAASILMPEIKVTSAAETWVNLTSAVAGKPRAHRVDVSDSFTSLVSQSSEPELRRSQSLFRSKSTLRKGDSSSELKTGELLEKEPPVNMLSTRVASFRLAKEIRLSETQRAQEERRQRDLEAAEARLRAACAPALAHVDARELEEALDALGALTSGRARSSASLCVAGVDKLIKAAVHKLAQARSRQATLARTEEGLRDAITRTRDRPESVGAALALEDALEKAQGSGLRAVDAALIAEAQAAKLRQQQQLRAAAACAA